jgi:hypothetical protein
MAIARIKIAGFSGNKYQAWKASIFFGGCCTSSAISMGHFPQPNQQRVCWSPDLLLRTAERKLRKLLPKGAKWRWRRPKILPGSSQWFIGLVVKSSKWGYSINNWGRTMVFFSSYDPSSGRIRRIVPQISTSWGDHGMSDENRKRDVYYNGV